MLANGLTLIVCEDHSLPSVTLKILVEAGSRHDPADRDGLAYLTAKSVLFGSKGRTAATVQEELDFMGANIESSASEDFADFSLRITQERPRKRTDESLWTRDPS